jgi:arylsulfatase A-like enzyme
MPRNIIHIMTDDLGYGELGCYGNTFNETPHLDALAATGMRFTSAYSAAPVCSPSRAALLTGQHPARVGILDYLRPDDAPLSTEHQTISKVLQANDYATCLVGKWHLSGYKYHGAKNVTRPVDHGFDQELCNEIKGVGNGANFFPYVFRKQPVSWTNIKKSRLGPNEYLTDRMNVEATDFITRNKDRPFFLYLAHFAPHTILNGKPELVDKYRKKRKPGPVQRKRCYLCDDEGMQTGEGHHWSKSNNPHLAAMTESIDDGVGLIVAKLKELGLLENTIIVFTSDHGGETNITTNGPLREGKSTLYEGGIRVPLIVSWPGKTRPGSVCDSPVTTADFYPTYLEATGTQTEQYLDGQSMMPILRNPRFDGEPQNWRREFFWHYPLEKPHFLGGRSSGAMRQGPWKLIEFFDTKKVELYNVETDIGETKDLAKAHPDIAKRMHDRLKEWREEILA